MSDSPVTQEITRVLGALCQESWSKSQELGAKTYISYYFTKSNIIETISHLNLSPMIVNS